MPSVNHQNGTCSAVRIAPVEIPVLSESVLTKTVQIGSESQRRKPLLVLQNETIGHLAAPGGTRILADLIAQFIALETLPVAVILQGLAVRLANEINPVGEQLVQLTARQVPLLVCRESLSELHIQCTIKDARLVSQREIAETLLKAEPIYWL